MIPPGFIFQQLKTQKILLGLVETTVVLWDCNFCSLEEIWYFLLTPCVSRKSVFFLRNSSSKTSRHFCERKKTRTSMINKYAIFIFMPTQQKAITTLEYSTLNWNFLCLETLLKKFVIYNFERVTFMEYLAYSGVVF